MRRKDKPFPWQSPLVVIRAFVESGLLIVRLGQEVVGNYPSPRDCRQTYYQSLRRKPDLGVSVHVSGDHVYLARVDVDYEASWEWASSFWEPVEAPGPRMRPDPPRKSAREVAFAFLASPYEAVVLSDSAPGVNGDGTLHSVISRTPGLQGRVSARRMGTQWYLVRTAHD